MPNVTGMRTTENIQQARRVVDMAKEIALLDPQIAPFITILKRVKEDTRVAYNPKFEWLEDALLANTTVTTAAVSSASATTVAVEDGSIFRPSDVLNVPGVGENMLVVSVSGNNLTVIRGFGTAEPAASIAADAQIINLGAAMTEGSRSRIALSTQEKPEYNYTQILRTPIKLSKTEEASKLYGGKDKSYQRRKALQEHKRDMCGDIFFGQRMLDLSGEEPRRSMGGLTSFISKGNVADFSNEPEVDYFDFDERVAYPLFLHGSENKLLIAGPRLQTAINKWAEKKLVTKPETTSYGVRIRKIITSFGDLPVIFDRLLAGPTYGGYGLALDMDYIRYVYLEGRDTKLSVNIHPNDLDGVSDEYITEFSLEVKCPKTHVLITGA